MNKNFNGLETTIVNKILLEGKEYKNLQKFLEIDNSKAFETHFIKSRDFLNDIKKLHKEENIEVLATAKQISINHGGVVSYLGSIPGRIYNTLITPTPLEDPIFVVNMQQRRVALMHSPQYIQQFQNNSEDIMVSGTLLATDINIPLNLITYLLNSTPFLGRRTAELFEFSALSNEYFQVAPNGNSPLQNLITLSNLFQNTHNMTNDVENAAFIFSQNVPLGAVLDVMKLFWQYRNFGVNSFLVHSHRFSTIIGPSIWVRITPRLLLDGQFENFLGQINAFLHSRFLAETQNVYIPLTLRFMLSAGYINLENIDVALVGLLSQLPPTPPAPVIEILDPLVDADDLLEQLVDEGQTTTETDDAN
jgi:hypothetical protein